MLLLSHRAWAHLFHCLHNLSNLTVQFSHFAASDILSVIMVPSLTSVNSQGESLLPPPSPSDVTDPGSRHRFFGLPQIVGCPRQFGAKLIDPCPQVSESLTTKCALQRAYGVVLLRADVSCIPHKSCWPAYILVSDIINSFGVPKVPFELQVGFICLNGVRETLRCLVFRPFLSCQHAVGCKQE